MSNYSRSPSPTMRHISIQNSPYESIPPKTIILGLWPFAHHEQIEYYVQGYKTLYPTAKVLLLPNSNTTGQHIEQILFELIGDQEKKCLHLQQQQQQQQIARATLHPHHQHHIDSSADILIHLFGEDSAAQVCRLLRAYHRRTEATLGVRALVLDAVPAVVAPTAHTLQRNPHLFLLFVYLCVVALLGRAASLLASLTADAATALWCCFASSSWATGMPSSWAGCCASSASANYYGHSVSGQVRRDLADPQLLPADARRCYIFPEKDIMFAWDLPKGADGVVDRQDFAVMRHLVDLEQRWSGDQERYWLGIENAWEGR